MNEVKHGLLVRRTPVSLLHLFGVVTLEVVKNDMDLVGQVAV